MENEIPPIHFEVRHKGVLRPAHSTGRYEHPETGYEDFTFDVEHADVNGTFVALMPYMATPVLKVVNKKLYLEEQAVGGNGWFLEVDPFGLISRRYVDAKWEENPLITHGAGTVFCWIANYQGLVIENTTQPKFRPGPKTEIEILEGSDQDKLPREFWRERKELMRMRPLPEEIARQRIFMRK